MATGKFSPVFIIGHIKIGSVSDASCVNLGNNWPTGFESHSKTNQGFGEISGDHNRLDEAKAYLQDSDLIDMFSSSGDDIPDWALTLMKKAEQPAEPEEG